jgi:membrane protease subunit (stomatin/prohibitin family)
MMRRRPLARAAIVGGAGYAAGRHMANTRQAEDDQNAQIAQLQAQQAAPVAAAPAAPAAGGADMVAQLESLKKLLDEGILTQAEFDMQKQKLLAGA